MWPASLDLRAAVVAARMAGEHLRAIDDAHLVRVGEHRQRAANVRVRDGVVVQVEADIRRLADLDRDALEQRRRIVGQRQQMRRFLGEHLAHAAVRFVGTAPVGGQAIAPGLGLGIEIIEIGEAAGGEERIPHVSYGSFHAAFFVAARHRHRAGFIAVVPGKAQQRRMEADRIAASFQHRTLEIVVEQNARHTAPCRRRRATWPRRKFSMRASRKKRRKIWREWLSTMTNAISGRRARPISQMAEVAPVDLCLFAGQAAQTQIRLGRSDAADDRRSGGGSDRGCRDSRARAP